MHRTRSQAQRGARDERSAGVFDHSEGLTVTPAESGDGRDDLDGDKDMELEKRVDEAYNVLCARGDPVVTRDVLKGIVLGLEGKGKGKGMTRVGERVLLACEMLGKQIPNVAERKEEMERDKAFASLEDARRDLDEAQKEMMGLDKERKEMEDELESKRKMLFLMGVVEKREGMRMERIGKGYAELITDLRTKVEQGLAELESIVNTEREVGEWDEELVKRKIERLGMFEETRNALSKLHAAHLRGDGGVSYEDNDDGIGEALEKLQKAVEEKEERLSRQLERAAGLGWLCEEDVDWLTTFRTESAPALEGMLSAERERVDGYVGRIHAAIRERKQPQTGFVEEVREVVGGGVEDVQTMMDALEAIKQLQSLPGRKEEEGDDMVISTSGEKIKQLLARKQAKIGYGLSLGATVRTMLEDSRQLK